MENEILKIESVSKNFGALKAINDLSFNVFEFEIFGIAGPNGSGKSTLFDLIMGLLKPTHGKILLDARRFFKPEDFPNTLYLTIGRNINA